MAQSSTWIPPLPADTAAGTAAVLACDPVSARRIGALLSDAGWSAQPSDGADQAAEAIVACVDLGGPNPADHIRRMAAEAPGAALVVVTPPARGNDIRRALRAGAAAVIFDAQLDTVLAATVNAARAGMAVVPREAREHVEKPVLSLREKQILNLVVAGLTNRQIAERLYLAESTVKTHLTAAFGKLGVRSRSEAAAALLDPEEPLLAGLLDDLEPEPALTA